jgi:hypothetical protein
VPGSCEWVWVVCVRPAIAMGECGTHRQWGVLWLRGWGVSGLWAMVVGVPKLAIKGSLQGLCGDGGGVEKKKKVVQCALGCSIRVRTVGCGERTVRAGGLRVRVGG